MPAILVAFLLTGVMLSGWGARDWRGFLADPARTSAFILMLAGFAFLAAANLGLRPLRPGRTTHAGQTLALATMAIGSAWLVWLLPHNDRRGIFVFEVGEWLRWTGLALLCAGGAIRVRALHDLGAQFSAYVTLQPEHRLVESGIYSTVRHPLYLSLILAAPGFALVFRSQLVFPVLVLTVVFVADRVRREECLLTGHFGELYSDYRSRTWKLFPFVL